MIQIQEPATSRKRTSRSNLGPEGCLPPKAPVYSPPLSRQLRVSGSGGLSWSHSPEWRCCCQDEETWGGGRCSGMGLGETLRIRACAPGAVTRWRPPDQRKTCSHLHFLCAQAQVHLLLLPATQRGSFRIPQSKKEAALRPPAGARGHHIASGRGALPADTRSGLSNKPWGWLAHRAGLPRAERSA